ncbi:MAG: ribosome small subunit-dependent GTPase A, partial [Planctomycetaceae bacterium]
ELTRRRTIVGEEDSAGGVNRAIDESSCIAGRVIIAAGLNSLVESSAGDRYECTVRRVLRTMSRDSRNVVVAGDRVLFQPIDGAHGVIERIEPRHGIISRADDRKKHIIVANVDQALIVVSASDPPFKPNLVDRLLVSAQSGGVRPIICVNKVDLVGRERLQAWAGLYSRLGYDVVLASAVRGWGIPRLRGLLAGVETVVTGQSGVGKSSLLNSIQPGLTLETGNISDWTRKGKHTTRKAMLLRLNAGGWVADTPGIRQMQLWNVPSTQLEAFFPEFRPFIPHCRFPDCTHRHEDGCRVKDGLERDLISPSRYASYRRLLATDTD